MPGADRLLLASDQVEPRMSSLLEMRRCLKRRVRFFQPACSFPFAIRATDSKRRLRSDYVWGAAVDFRMRNSACSVTTGLSSFCEWSDSDRIPSSV